MVFTEIQKFHPAVMWSLRLLVIGMIALALYLPILRETNFGYFIAIIPLLVWLLLEIVKLTVQINQERISMNMRPFTSKSFTWDEIDTSEVIDYGFVGGWGVRVTKSYGIVYNTRGSKGILIHLKNGKRFVFGIQSEDEAKRAISNFS